MGLAHSHPSVVTGPVAQQLSSGRAIRSAAYGACRSRRYVIDLILYLLAYGLVLLDHLLGYLGLMLPFS